MSVLDILEEKHPKNHKVAQILRDRLESNGFHSAGRNVWYRSTSKEKPRSRKSIAVVFEEGGFCVSVRDVLQKENWRRRFTYTEANLEHVPLD